MKDKRANSELTRRTLSKGIPQNATARRFRRKVSCEMQVRLPAQTTMPKMRDGGGIGGQVFADVRLLIVLHSYGNVVPFYELPKRWRF